MPFQMTHLCIAKIISNNLSKYIDSLPQFYLGNIAPDAIHNRANYISDYKKVSHLCVGSENWGMITNNNEWIDNILKFLDKYKNSPDYSFILGYCSHILSDLYNNITVWMPFKQKCLTESDKEYGNLYHSESGKIEINLALTIADKDCFWDNLKRSKGIDLENIIFADEIEMHKTNILYLWFADKNIQDISGNKVVTYDGTLQFIKDASNFVLDNLAKLYVKS
ncbi:MAG: zinc dependent phospholipase C family protein [Eubacteriales bacterium]